MKNSNLVHVKFDIGRSEVLPLILKSWENHKEEWSAIEQPVVGGLINKFCTTEKESGMRLVGFLMDVYEPILQEDFNQLPCYVVDGKPLAQSIATIKIHAKRTLAYAAIVSFEWMASQGHRLKEVTTKDFQEFVRLQAYKYKSNVGGVRTISLLSASIAYELMMDGTTEDEVYARL